MARSDRVSGPPIRAAGGVVWRKSPVGVEIAVIHRPRYDDWSLPKGKLTSGETDLDGAVREVLEETGFHVRVGRPLGETRYDKASPVGPRLKIVRWWAMQAEHGAFAPGREVDAMEWMSPEEASDRLTRDLDREVLERFTGEAAPARVVLLLRHAVAVSRQEWSGRDRDRPLDECGIAQADALLRTLAHFEIGRIVSADVRRCYETVQPLAEVFGLEIAPEPVLSKSGYPGREEEALDLIRSLGDLEHDAVVCSQGEVIPDLIDRLAMSDGISIERPPRAPKGSTWVLGLDPRGRFVAVDYLDAPSPAECR